MSVKYFFSAIAAMLIFPASALLPGDVVPMTLPRVEWLNCSPMPLGKLNAETDRHIPALRGVVFMYTRADGSDALAALLENARRSFGGKVLISVITPDDMADAGAFRERHRDSRIRFGVDLERKLTPQFMQGGGMILPTGFLLDAGGRVLWRGEGVDLPEAAEKALNGKLDVAIQKKLAPLMDQMQQALSSGNMFSIIKNAEKILAVDPGHPAALRMALFASDAMRDPEQAWRLVMREFRKVPHISRIGFTALGVVMQYPQLQHHLPELIKDFSLRDVPARTRYAFADALLRNFPYDLDAVLGAKKIIAGTPLALNAPPEEMGLVLALRARLCYALGDIAGAEENQREAVQMYTVSGDKAGKIDAEKILAFFRGIRKETSAKK